MTAKKVLSCLLCTAMLTAGLQGMVVNASESDNEPYGGIQLPLTDEKITLKFWYPVGWDNLGTMKDYNDSDAFQKLEELTNVHIEWIHPATGTEKESFNLLFASDEMPDFIYTTPDWQYSDGPEAAVEDGYYLDLTDKLDELSPNYSKIIADPDVAHEVTTDNGTKWGYSFIYMGEGKQSNNGPTIRKDFLDAVGMDVPVTYDDWHEVLTAFKDQLGIESPLYLFNKISRNSEFVTGFGTAKDFYQEDGVVKYGPIEDGYGEYLKMMNQWYQEGLIDKNFSLNTSENPEDDLVLNDKIGAWWSWLSWTGTSFYPNRGATNPDFDLIAAPYPVQKEGDPIHLRAEDMKVSTLSVAISADCEYPDIAMQWLDLMYSPEVADIFNYGTREGESFIVNDDGSKQWGDLIMHNPDGLTVSQARTKCTVLNALYEDYNRVTSSWTDEQKESQQRWLNSADNDWYISPSITMTAEENRDFATIMGDITTFVDEETCKFIMGTNSLTFEEFVQQIKDMNIEQAIADKQAALDRYNER